MTAFLGWLPGAGSDFDWDAAVQALASRTPGAPVVNSLGTARIAIAGAEPGRAPDGGALALVDGQICRAGERAWLAPAALTDSGLEPREVAGCFASGVVDQAGARVRLQRDPFGTRPLFFAQVGAGWAFASEAPMLLAGGVAAELDPDCLPSVVHFRFLPGPMTVFRGIHQVPAGSAVTLVPGRAPTLERLEMPRRTPRDHGTLAEEVDRASAALEASMDALAGLARTVAVPLSGGIDSSLVAALARPRFARVTGFSAAIEGFENPELARARTVAARLGIEHRVVTVSRSDIGRLYPVIMERLATPPRHYNNFIVARLYEAMAEAGVDGVLQGDSGDTLFSAEGAADLERFRRRLQHLHQLPAGVRRPLAALLGRLPSPRLGRIAAMLTHSYEAAQARLPATDVLGPFDSTRRARAVAERLTGGYALHPDLEALSLALGDGHDIIWHGLSIVVVGGAQTERNDRLATPLGLNLLYPFHDLGVQRAGLDLPLALREIGTVDKPVLRAVAARLLGEDVGQWPKMGFPSPEQEWMTGPLADHLAPVFQSTPFLDALLPLEARRRLRLPDDRQLIWTLMALQALHTTFDIHPPPVGTGTHPKAPRRTGDRT